MTIRNILTEPNKILRQISKNVDKVGKEEQELMNDMLETMYAANGIGLAAVQIGVPKRIIVMDLSKEGGKEIKVVILEPCIEWILVCCMISVTDLLAISSPGGFTSENLPVGIQLVGKPRGDIELLKIAHLFETETNFYRKKPSAI